MEMLLSGKHSIPTASRIVGFAPFGCTSHALPSPVVARFIFCSDSPSRSSFALCTSRSSYEESGHSFVDTVDSPEQGSAADCLLRLLLPTPSGYMGRKLQAKRVESNHRIWPPAGRNPLSWLRSACWPSISVSPLLCSPLLTTWYLTSSSDKRRESSLVSRLGRGRSWQARPPLNYMYWLRSEHRFRGSKGGGLSG